VSLFDFVLNYTTHHCQSSLFSIWFILSFSSHLVRGLEMEIDCCHIFGTLPLDLASVIPHSLFFLLCLLSVLQVARHSHTGRPHLFLQHLWLPCLLASSPVFHFYTIFRLSCSGLLRGPPLPHLLFLCPQPCHASCAMPSRLHYHLSTSTVSAEK